MNGFDVDWTKLRRKPNRFNLDLDYFDAYEYRQHKKYPNKPQLVRAKWEQARDLVWNRDRNNWHKTAYSEHYMKLYVDGLISKKQLDDMHKDVIDIRDRPSMSYAWSIARHLQPRENRTYGPA